jgi:hypothetical protein
MQISKNKTLAILVALILASSMAVAIAYTTNEANAAVTYPIPGHPGDGYDLNTYTAIQQGMNWPPSIADMNASANRIQFWTRYHDQVATHVFIITAPNPIGVGQGCNIVMFNPQVPLNSGGSITAGYTLRYYYTFQVTTPNGTVENYPTSTPPAYSSWSMNEIVQYNSTTLAFGSDSTGSTYMTYTPDTVGNYTFMVNFLPQTVNYNATQGVSTDWTGITLLGSSYTTTLTVQQNPVSLTGLTTPPYNPVPTQFWMRPIEQENVQWATIASNWLETTHDFNNGGSQNAYQPDGTAPNTGHILWTTPEEDSGILGGSNSGREANGQYVANAFNTGSQYQPRWTQPTYGGEGPILMYGRLYYSPSIYYTGYSELFNCLDLKTGKFLYQVNTTAITGARNLPQFGYYYDQDDINEHGYQNPGWLFTTNYAIGYQPEYGYAEFHFTGVPTAYEITGPNGEGLRYVLSNVGTTAAPVWNLMQWNSSKMIPMISSGAAPNTAVYQGNVPTSPAPTVVTTAPYTWNGSAFTNALTIPATFKALGSTATSIVTYAVTWVNSAWINYTTTSPLNNVLQGGNWMSAPSTSSPLTLAGINPGGIPCYDWNVSLTYNGSPFVFTTAPTIAAASLSRGIVWGYNGSWPTGTSAPSYNYPDNVTAWCIDMSQAATTGKATLLYVETINTELNPTSQDPITGNQNLLYEHSDPNEDVFIAIAVPSQTYYVWNMTTGAQMWTSDSQTQTISPYGYYTWPSLISGTQVKTAYGMLFTGGYSGSISAYSLATGQLVWRYAVIPPGTAGVIKSSPGMMDMIADGKLYVGCHEHSAETPLEAGNDIKCLNITTTDPNGQLIWAMAGWVYPSSMAVADGVLAYLNNYDESFYAVGQGPTQTTVSAPSASIQMGRSLVITGTVYDVSAGSQQTVTKANFPNGLPAVSDASMSQWMEYVYMQKSMPTNVTGVTVQLAVIDANGNYRPIGTTTTDATGKYSFQYTPDITGKYTVVASFAGSQSYYGSSDESSFAVDAAATAAPSSTSAPAQGLATMDFWAGVAAIIVVIVLVGAAIIVLMRRHP